MHARVLAATPWRARADCARCGLVGVAPAHLASRSLRLVDSPLRDPSLPRLAVVACPYRRRRTRLSRSPRANVPRRDHRRARMDQNSGSPQGQGGLAFTLVADEQDVLHSAQDLRAALEKGTDELKLGALVSTAGGNLALTRRYTFTDTLRRIIISTLNGNPHVRLCTSARRA